MGSEQDYIDAQKEVSEAITEYGRKVYIVYEATSGDPWNPITGEPIERPVSGIIKSYNVIETTGTVIAAQDKKIIIARPPIADMQEVEDWYDYFFNPIKMGDSDIIAMKLRDGNVTYSIVGVKSVAPGDIVIMYELQCRV